MYENYFKHFDISKITKEVEDFVTNNILESREYVIMRKENDKVIAYCTRCNKEFEVEKVVHNVIGTCPLCGAEVVSKNINYGRKALGCKELFYTFCKSKVSNEYIVCKGYEVIRTGYEDYKNVKSIYVLKSIYIFGNKESIMIEDLYGWQIRKSIFDISIRSSVFGWGRRIPWIDYESFLKASKGTPYEYSMVNDLKGNQDAATLLKYLELFTKNNLIESIVKVGGYKLIEERIRRGSYGNLINLNGKTIYEMLRIDKKFLREITKHKIIIQPKNIAVFQLAKKYKSKLNFDDLQDISLKFDVDKLKEAIKVVNIDKLYRYLNKQKAIEEDQYISYNNVLIDYVDYIRDLKILDEDITSEFMILPSNLRQAHQKTLVKVEVKKDPKISGLIERRYKTLSKYRFIYNNLEIRPIKDIGELIREGKELKHCVGRYAKDHAKGKTNIFVIRNINKKDIPFYTVEINCGEIIQVRGLRNCSPTEEIELFIEKFKLEKLNKAIKVA